MADLKLPGTQLDAIPLIDASQVGDAGELEIIGGRVTKYWRPAATGINRTAMSLDPQPNAFGRLLLLSNWLDVRGCSTFQLVMTRDALNLANDIVHGIGMYVQYRDSAGNVGRTGDAGTQTQTQMGSFTTIQKPASAGAYPWLNTFGYQLDLAPINPVTFKTSMMGNLVRLWFTETNGVIKADERFSLEIYGQAGPVTRWT
jgi:hypothetical protein